MNTKTYQTIAIIAEYNPFHTGHAYQIETIKKMYHPENIVILMSGNYVQRGIPAIADVWTRTNLLLTQNVQLVLELPGIISTASAPIFASGAISILEKLGTVDAICFGCETTDFSLLDTLAEILSAPDDQFNNQIKQLVNSGKSYAYARECAVKAIYPELPEGFLSKPNIILALEYLVALKKSHSSIVPLPLFRNGADYNDLHLKSNTFPSASALRAKLNSNCALFEIENYIPEMAYSILRDANGTTLPINENDFSEYLYMLLLNHTTESLLTYQDVSKNLADRILSNLYAYTNWKEFTSLLKTKDVAYSRISRALLHILLGYTKEDLPFANYTRLLALDKNASSLLKKAENLTCITKVADYKNLFSNPKEQQLFEKDLKAAALYKRVLYTKFGTKLPNDFQKSPIIY